MRCFRQISLCLLLTGQAVTADELTREETDFFETKIRPVLVRECYGCHSDKSGNVRGGLRLDSRQLMRIGGGSGPAVVPGSLEESWLYNAITHQDFVMPPKRKLPQHVIHDFRTWIEMGAPDPRDTSIAVLNSEITEADIEQAKDSFWAYQTPQLVTPETVEDAGWLRTDIDRFVLAKLEQADMTPAGDAEPRVLLRRLSFDLVGLPPTPGQIESFTESWHEDPDRAVAEVVDRLLERDQFGETWGRQWLDVARYGESTGREVNMTYPHAWRYRDYVIDSFNEDKPFDRFIQEQLAGDLLPVDSDEQWAENLVATTFLAIGAKNVNEQNPVQFAADVADEQIDATTRVFLGMSVACARCHDHKFDAIPQADYYALAGIFSNMETYFGNPQSEFGSFSAAQEQQTSTLLVMPIDDANPFDLSYSDQELASLRDDMVAQRREMAEWRRNRDSSANAQRERARLLSALALLSGKLAAVDEDGRPLSFCMGVQEVGAPSDAVLLVRGEIDQPAQTVPRGFPQVLTTNSTTIDGGSSGRLELARWIGSADNPLTARVMVNRIWQNLIGRGIVTSTENFGTTGQFPSHPGLLDYLAVRFVESGWSVKAVIREIATSRVYRMSSEFNEDYHEYDPDNALLWRANPRRLSAEAIRDAMLAVSGELDLDRPRASEVARAGFTRVQSGRLGRPGNSMQNRQRGPQAQRRPGGQFGPQPQGGFGGPRRPQGQPGAPARRRGPGFGNPLDMVDARFRSVYLPIVRDEEPRSLVVFDYADSSAITGTRESSNTANQALYMMNNPFVLQQSRSFAGRVAGISSTPAEHIDNAFQLAWGRGPTDAEKAAAARFFLDFESSVNDDGQGLSPLTVLCQSLFASAEFRYVD